MTDKPENPPAFPLKAKGSGRIVRRLTHPLYGEQHVTTMIDVPITDAMLSERTKPNE